MKSSCSAFRVELERVLDAARVRGEFVALGGHEHLLACADCRALLADEEALEQLLATLPAPRLPRRLADRLLARLRGARLEPTANAPIEATRDLDELLALDKDASIHAEPEFARDVLARLESERKAARARSELDVARRDRSLDRLLDRAADVDVPARIARDVLARVNAARATEARHLDHVLDRDRADETPVGLASRVLAGLAAGRHEAARASKPAPARRAPHAESVASSAAPRSPSIARWKRVALPLAAGFVIALAAWALWARQHRAPETAPIVRTQDGAPRGESLPGAPKFVREGANGAAPRGEAPPSDEVLAALDVLEQWDLLLQDDVDVLLSTLAPADQSLLDLHEGEDEALPKDEAPVEIEKKNGAKKG